ncbi:MAG: TraB/GumN family protein [archaeon]
MIKIIGTSHVSPQSLKEIDRVIAEVKPDCVALELDRNRFEALKRGDHVNLSAIRYIGLKSYFVAKILSIIQEHLGKKTGVMPGEEMMEAFKAGARSKADIALIDRDIRVTLERMKTIPLREKLKIILGVFKKVPVGEKFDLKKVPSDKLVENMVEHVKEVSPTLYKVLIEERDIHMARVLVELSKKYPKIVAVVGMGHKRGMEKELAKIKTAKQTSE